MRLRHFTKVRAELASTSGMANAAA
jgi:hypothetical protein